MRVGFTDEEIGLIQTAADSLQIPVTRLLADTAIALAVRVSDSQEGKSEPRHDQAVSWRQNMPSVTAPQWQMWVSEILGLRRILSGIGTNMNQIAAKANSTNEIDEALPGVTLAVARAVARLHRLLDSWNALGGGRLG